MSNTLKIKVFHQIFHTIIYLSAFIQINSLVMCCTYSQTTVVCNQTVNINEYFKNLSSYQVYFEDLFLYSPIEELPLNVFDLISFRNIRIYNSTNLKRIHTYAFGVTRTYTQRFTFYGNFKSQLVNNPPDYDIYIAFSSLLYLTTIYISLADNQNHIIPDNAFQPSDKGIQKDLTFVEFYGYFTITEIGSQVFYELPNIKQIVFRYVIVKKISADSFKLQVNKQIENISITFLNTSLTDDSFEPGVFTDTGRVVSLDLTQNKIKTIDQKVFGPFLQANQLNQLNLKNNPLNCSNPKQYAWIVKDKDYKNRILDAFCANGTSFWDWIEGSQVDVETQPPQTQTHTSTHTPTSHTPTTQTPTTQTSTTEKPQTPALTRPQTSTTQISSVTKTESTTNSVSASMSTDSGGDSASDIHTIIKSLENLINSTKDDNSLESGQQISDILTQIQKIQNSLDSMDPLDYEMSLNVSTIILNVLSNLLNQNNAWNQTMETERTGIASDILKQIQFTTFFTTCNPNNYNKTVNRITNDNIITDIFKNFDQKIDFQANQSSILIPQEVIHMNGITYCGNSSFANLINRLDEYLIESLSDKQTINTNIISYSLINGTESIELTDGLMFKLILKHKTQLEFGDKINCAFWDFSLKKWSSNGCQLLINESDRHYSICQCNHLTNFAAIMDISGREDDSYLKSLLTYIFCGISTVCLILTVWLLLRPKRDNSNTITNSLLRTRTLITLNLSIMLIIANILIIFGMDRKNNKPLCQTMSAILLYSLLSSFSWMFLEGYHLYRMTVQIFNSNTRKLFLFLFGYGIPIVTIIIGLLVIWIRDQILFDALIGEYFCWISSQRYPYHIWLFTGPALIAIVFNIIMMFILITRVFKSNKNKAVNRYKLKIKQIFGITSLLFNLGITWLAFILYIKQFGSFFSYFSYVFIVLNGSQGIFIFIYHLVIHQNKNQKKPVRKTLALTLSSKWSTKINSD